MLGKNIANIEEGLLSMVTVVEQMSRLLPQCILHCECSEMDRCEELALEVKRQAKVLTRRLIASNPHGEVVREIIRFPLRLERIADELASVTTCCRMTTVENLAFGNAALDALNAICVVLLDMICTFREVVIAPNNSGAQCVMAQGTQAARMLQDARLGHWLRLESGGCSPEVGALFLDILDSLKSVNEYLQKMADNLLGLEALGNAVENRGRRPVGP